MDEAERTKYYLVCDETISEDDLKRIEESINQILFEKINEPILYGKD